MTAGMSVPLVVFLSTVVLHSVSAGGVYCAKTARARAAALGLPYPGEDGAPDLLGPTYEMDHQPYSESDPDLPHQLELTPQDDTIDNYAQYQGFERFAPNYVPYEPRQSQFDPDPELNFPSGELDSDHKSTFGEVKHVALPTLPAAYSQPDLVKRDPQDYNQPLSFVYGEHGRVADESDPNRRGMPRSGVPPPQSRNSDSYQRGLTGYGQGREVPVLGSFQFTNKGQKNSRAPVMGGWGRPRFPNQFAQYLQKSLSSKPFSKGNPILRRLFKPKSVPVRKKVVNSN